MFGPVERRKLVDSIADSLRDAIVGGRFATGDRLPSERDLATKYEVNRSSVREALLRLEAWGLIEIRHGGAARVRDVLVTAGVQVLPYLLEQGGRVDTGLLRDLHEVRSIFYGWCAERAAFKADTEAVERLEALAAEMADVKKKPIDFQRLDYQFFEELVRITDNRILLLLANVVREVYMRRPERFAAMYAKGIFNPDHHKHAVAAIRQRDGAAAGAAMRAHAATAIASLQGKGS